MPSNHIPSIQVQNITYLNTNLGTKLCKDCKFFKRDMSLIWISSSMLLPAFLFLSLLESDINIWKKGIIVIGVLVMLFFTMRNAWLFSNRYAKCLFKSRQNKSESFMITGRRKRSAVDYSYCSTERELDYPGLTCGASARNFIEKEPSRWKRMMSRLR
jgi:hypothetical protein